MNDNLHIQGDGNIGIQNVGENANVSVMQILAKSFEYNDLLDKINTKQKLFDRTPENETEERLQLSAEINELKEIFEQFKRDVTALAETFNKIEINTDRLRRAKEFFDKGEIGESRAVLEMELEQMRDEQKYLLEQKDRYDNEILPNLINNSEEFYLLARSTQTDYENPHRFEANCKYFEDSIKSYPTKDNVFNYAKFLQEHNQFNDAERYYSLFLKSFSNEIQEDEYATTLNNLAILHKLQNQYKEALNEYEEALSIYRKLAETNPNTYLPNVAITLNNLAALHQNQNRYDEALSEYEESLVIFRKLAETNPQTYLPYVAGNLINLSIYFQENVIERGKSLEYVMEAVLIVLPLVEKVPYTQRYLQSAMFVLRNWDLSDEEVSRMIAERVKGNE